MLKIVHTICIPFGIENVWLCIGAHTLSEGAIEGLQVGNMFHGFIMGAVSGAGGYAINNFGQELGRAGKIASSAVLGGVVSEIGGGKFANGAITAAYSMMFNEMMHPRGYTKTRKLKMKMFGQIPFDENPATMANVCIDLNVTIIEKHDSNGNVYIDGYGVMADINGANLSPGLEMTINADNESKSFYFSKQYSGATVTQKGYHYFGEVHTGKFSISNYHSVSVTFSPSFAHYDSSMGRSVPTLPGTLGLIPSQWVMKKSFKLK